MLQLPDCSNKLNVTTNHDKANISIAHTLKIMMRVERGDDEYLDSKGNRKVSMLAQSTANEFRLTSELYL